MGYDLYWHKPPAPDSAAMAEYHRRRDAAHEWPRDHDRVNGQTCRLETTKGTQFRIHIRDVESIETSDQGAP